MEILTVVLGIVLLGWGRKLFWLFVALTGFLMGMAVTGVILGDQPGWVRLLVGLGIGLVGALLAVFLKRLAFALGGFYAGAYLALIGAQSWGAGGSPLWFLAGGVLGAILAAWLMDWVIVLLSCLVGAGAVVAGLSLGPMNGLLVFVVLAAAGIFFQARGGAQSRKS